MIRPAEERDVEELVSLGRLLHDLSSYREFGYSDEKVAKLLSQLIASPDGCVFVSEQRGEIVGGFAGGITEQWFSTDVVAFDLSLFLHPQKRSGFTAIRLVRAFIAWAKSKGAREIQLGITTGMNEDGTSELYRSLGFEHRGTLFRMEGGRGD